MCSENKNLCSKALFNFCFNIANNWLNCLSSDNPSPVTVKQSTLKLWRFVQMLHLHTLNRKKSMRNSGKSYKCFDILKLVWWRPLHCKKDGSGNCGIQYLCYYQHTGRANEITEFKFCDVNHVVYTTNITITKATEFRMVGKFTDTL